jgi:hypothetical protein
VPDPISSAPRGTRATTGRTAPLVAVGMCGLQAVVLAVIGVVTLVELVSGAASSRLAVWGALLVVTAVLLAVLAWGWWVGSDRQRAPTVVWGLLLVPVGLGLSEPGDRVLGGAVVLVGVVTVAVAMAAARPAAGDGD